MWDEIRGDTLAPQTVYEAFGTSLAAAQRSAC